MNYEKKGSCALAVIAKRGNYRDSLIAFIRTLQKLDRICAAEDLEQLEEFVNPDIVLFEQHFPQERGKLAQELKSRWPYAWVISLNECIGINQFNVCNNVDFSLPKGVSAGELLGLIGELINKNDKNLARRHVHSNKIVRWSEVAF